MKPIRSGVARLRGIESSAVTAATLTSAAERGDDGEPPSGLAHVATASFLASRAAPSAGFWVALAGGVALARVGEKRGARVGYGASIAAMLQTVAIMGPARFGVPLTQALTAPLLGRLEAARVSALRQVLACAAIRLLHTTLTVAVFVLVLAGGVGAWTDSYDAIARRLPLLPEGTEAALIVTGTSLLAWAAFASTVQVIVYRRALRLWPAAGAPAAGAKTAEDVEPARRFDPRAIALAGAIAFCLLLASTTVPLLGAVSAWLALAWLAANSDRSVVPAGLAIAAALAGGVLLVTAIGGAGLAVALRRAARAGLLVLVATWIRAAAGAGGLREVSRRLLGRLRALPAVPEASRVLDELGSGRQLGDAARSVARVLSAAPKRPLALLDSVLAWVAAEAARFRPAAQPKQLALRARARDAMLVLAAALPAAVLVLG